MKDVQEQTLWSVVSKIVEERKKEIDPIMVDNLYKIRDFENVFPLLLSWDLDRTETSETALISYIITSYYFPPKRHLWLMAAQLRRGMLGDDEVLKWLPILDVGNISLPRAYQDFCNTVRVVLHDNPKPDANDVYQVSSGLSSIFAEQPTYEDPI